MLDHVYLVQKKWIMGRLKLLKGIFFTEPTLPYRVIAIDNVGPLPQTQDKSKYMLLVVDHFTRHATFIPIENITVEVIAEEMMSEVISLYGIPEILISDNIIRTVKFHV